MSNGAAIRAAAKASIFRSPAIFAGPSAFRRTSLPSSSATPPPAPNPAFSAVTSEKPPSEAVPQRPELNLDDWEFAGWSAEEVKPVEPSRVVFRPVPTFEEAKAATTDLKDAVQRSNISQVATADSDIIPKIPRHVAQAFTFLQESPEAQDVVASLACDKSVWNAIMSNEKVMEFYNNHQAAVITQVDSEDSTANINSSSNARESSADNNASSGFKGFIKNIKIKVEEVVSNITSFIQDILPSSVGLPGTKSAQSNAGVDKEAGVGVGAGATFFALAIAVVLVVLFKRA